MPLYNYRAANPEGQILKGRIEALHELDLETQLKRMGLLLLRARALHERRRNVKSMPRREIIGFLFQLEMLIRAGVPILTALGDLRESSESRVEIFQVESLKKSRAAPLLQKQFLLIPACFPTRLSI